MTADSTPKRKKKADQIVAGAKSAFLELGFERASVDEIARRAGVSKATVYAHFVDKETLFGAVVEDEANVSKQWLSDFPAFEAVLKRSLDGREPGRAEDAGEKTVRFLVDRFLRFLLRPVVQANYRITMAESGRFPRIGELMWCHGPAAGMNRISAFLTKVSELGYLDVDDPREAARVLCDFVDGDLCRRLRMGALNQPTEEQIQQEIDTIVRLFLRLYGPSSQGPA